MSPEGILDADRTTGIIPHPQPVARPQGGGGGIDPATYGLTPDMLKQYGMDKFLQQYGFQAAQETSPDEAIGRALGTLQTPPILPSGL